MSRTRWVFLTSIYNLPYHDHETCVIIFKINWETDKKLTSQCNPVNTVHVWPLMAKILLVMVTGSLLMALLQMKPSNTKFVHAWCPGLIPPKAWFIVQRKIVLHASDYHLICTCKWIRIYIVYFKTNALSNRNGDLVEQWQEKFNHLVSATKDFQIRKINVLDVKKIIAVIDATFAVVKRKSENLKKFQACTGFEPLASVTPVQCLNQLS